MEVRLSGLAEEDGNDRGALAVFNDRGALEWWQILVIRIAMPRGG